MEDNIIIEDIEFKEELYRKNIEKFDFEKNEQLKDEKNANN